MDNDEKTRLVNGWIAMHEHYRDKGVDDNYFWAFEKLDNLCKNTPELAWEIILGILEADSSESILENLSAGPLEDLLVYHGESVIEFVEVQAEKDPVFRKLLGGVWENAISADVWDRVQRLVEVRW
jgi:hypothetical protein